MVKQLFLILFVPIICIAQQQIPDLSLQTAEGSTVSLRSYLGKGPVEISFWALWCEPCKHELTAMSPVYDSLKHRGYTLVAISEDNQKSVAKVRAYASARGWQFPVLLDPDGEALRQFNGQTIPYAIIIDSAGKIHSTHIGYLSGDEAGIEQEIIRLLPSSGAAK